MRFQYLVALFIACFTFNLAAEEEITIEIPLEEDEANKDGFSAEFKLGAIFGWDVNQKVVGVSDGNYWNLGGSGSMRLNYLKEGSELTFGLRIVENYWRMPNLLGWARSEDLFQVQSGYSYAILSWLGVTISFDLQTSIFEGWNEEVSDYTYLLDGKEFEKSRSVKLTTPFQPLYLKEVAGLQFQAVKIKEADLKFQIAASFDQVFAENQKIITDENEETSTIQLKTLATFYQIGPYLSAAFKGKVFDNYLSYFAAISVMWPGFDTSESKKSFLDSLNVEGNAGIDVNLAKWLAISWALRIKRIPQIHADFQIHNHLMLTTKFEF